MKRETLYMIMAAMVTLCGVQFVSAQNSTERGKVNIIPQPLIQRGDSLYVNLLVDMNGTTVETTKSMDIIPVLADGNRSKDLPKVSIKGRRKYKEYTRQLTLMSAAQKAAYVAPYAVEKGYEGNKGTIKYSYVLPFEPWMTNAYLDAKIDWCGCGNNSQMITMQRLVNCVSTENTTVVEPYRITPYLAYVLADAQNDGSEFGVKAEAVKHRQMSRDAYLTFVVDKTDIRSNLGNNSKELQKIKDMVDLAYEDESVTISTITISGYASPEGTLAHNKRLSEGRAAAMKNYLQSRYEIPNYIYKVHAGGENWDGLVELLKTSDIKEKAQILKIIETVPIEKNRETKIMNLNGGAPYRYMLKNMFPKLRLVECKVDYVVKQFESEEIEQVFKTKPQNLSLSEMYTLAARYEKGSQEFIDVFETAVRMFPEDQTANLNAAVAALSRNDTAAAERYLSKVKAKVRIPEYDNAVGVMDMLNGNYDKAEQSLQAAADAGLAEAVKNLDELKTKRENIEEINTTK